MSDSEARVGTKRGPVVASLRDRIFRAVPDGSHIHPIPVFEHEFPDGLTVRACVTEHLPRVIQANFKRLLGQRAVQFGVNVMRSGPRLSITRVEYYLRDPQQCTIEWVYVLLIRDDHPDCVDYHWSYPYESSIRPHLSRQTYVPNVVTRHVLQALARALSGYGPACVSWS